jgi:hypothetical protein
VPDEEDEDESEDENPFSVSQIDRVELSQHAAAIIKSDQLQVNNLVVEEPEAERCGRACPVTLIVSLYPNRETSVNPSDPSLPIFL